MRTTKLVLIVVLGALVWNGRPASAGDEDKARIAQLEAEVARMAAEAAHLRTAYDQLAQNAARSTKAITAMASSLETSRDTIVALTQQRDQLRAEVKQLRADVVKRPADDPARLKLALRDEQARYANDVTKLHAQMHELTELANRRAVRATQAESALAVAQEAHAGELKALRDKLALAEATIQRLRAGR